MWLLAGQKAPDHSTIARFRTGFLAEACEDLFYQMVRRLKDAEELSMETVFIDGTKLEACANKYTFVWKKSVGKWEEKMFHKIQEAVRLLNHDYMQSFTVNLWLSGRKMPAGWNRVRLWTWQTKKQKSEISGAFPKVPGTAGNLRLAYGQLPGKEQLL